MPKKTLNTTGPMFTPDQVTVHTARVEIARPIDRIAVLSTQDDQHVLLWFDTNNGDPLIDMRLTPHDAIQLGERLIRHGNHA